MQVKEHQDCSKCLVGNRKPGDLYQREHRHSATRHHFAGDAACRVLRAIAFAARVGSCRNLRRKSGRYLIDCGPEQGHSQKHRQK